MKKILLVTVMCVSVLCGYAQRQVERIVEGNSFVWYKIRENGLVGVGNTGGKMLIEAKYDSIYVDSLWIAGTREYYFRVRTNGMEGIANKEGNILFLPNKFEQVTYHWTGWGENATSSFYFCVVKDGFMGIYDSKGSEIFAPDKYKWVDIDAFSAMLWDVSKAKFFKFKEDDYMGICDKEGNVIFPADKYDQVVVEANREQTEIHSYRVWKDGFAGICDVYGIEIFPPTKYEEVHWVSIGYYSVKEKGLRGACNLKGEVIIPCKYKNLGYNKNINSFYYIEHRFHIPLYIDINGNSIPRDNDQTSSSSISSSSSTSSNQSSSSSSGSGYVPRMIYTGVDMGTGVSVGAGSISTGTSTTIQTEKRCHLCAGTGICTTCNGRGQMINSYTGQYQDCPNCHAPLAGKCHSCGGTGRK